MPDNGQLAVESQGSIAYHMPVKGDYACIYYFPTFYFLLIKSLTFNNMNFTLMILFNQKHLSKLNTIVKLNFQYLSTVEVYH